MPKRILYVHACAGLGGAPLSLLYLIEQLDRNRYEPEVLFVGRAGEEVDLYRRRKVALRVLPDITTYPHARNAYLSLRSLRPWEIATRALQVLPSARRMRDELWARPVDLVHINTSALLPAGLAALWAGVPAAWQRRLDIVCLIAGLPPRGDSPSRIRRTVRRLVEATGFVSNVERRVVTLVRQHRLDDTVRFTGMRDDVPEMLAASAVVVWPGTVSHFARPLIEAAAMGRPVVASDLPSAREIVAPGLTGLLATPGDPRSFATAILDLIEHPGEAKRMGEAAFVSARERYDAYRNAASIISIYDEVLGQQTPGALA